MTFKHKLAKRLAINGTRRARLGWAASPESSPIILARRRPCTPWWPQASSRHVAVMVALLVAACSGSTPTHPDPNFVAIRISPRNLNLQLGARTRFLAYGFLAEKDSIPATVTWSATGGAISADGEFTAAADTGAYAVTAVHAERLWLGDSTSGAIVMPAPTLVGIAIEPRDPVVELNDSIEFRALGLLSTGDTVSVQVSWAAEGGSVTPKGDGTGQYKPDRPGRFRVRARADTLSDSTTVTVPDKTAVATVEVNPGSASLSVGQTVQLAATARDENGNALTGRTIAWASSAPSVSTVSGNGMVGAIAAGTAIVTATSEGKAGTASISVTAVSAPVASVDVTPASASLDVTATLQLTATPRDAEGNALTGRSVTWATDNPAVGTVSGGGRVTGIAVGTATVTASSEGKNGTAAITVRLAPVASVQVSPSSSSIGVGQAVQLSATLRDAVGSTLTGRLVSWTSGSPSIATVSSTGLVTGLAAGSATITASSEGKSGSATVVVSSGSSTGAAEPVFGGNGSDVLISRDAFDSYNDLDALRTGWGVSITTGNDVQMTADGGGRGGVGRAVLGSKNNATSGYTITRGISGSPRHLFVTFWFKMARQGESYGKWVIIRHDQEAQTGSRYEFPMATITTPERQQYARFLNRGETAGEDSPQNGDQGYYVWPGAPDPNKAFPVLSQDPLWGVSPLNPATGGSGPIDNGNWHRQTLEIRVGNGTSGYNRLWLDGVLYWDSSTSTANMIGVPNTFEWATVSASEGDPYKVWYDDVIVWRR